MFTVTVCAHMKNMKMFDTIKWDYAVKYWGETETIADIRLLRRASQNTQNRSRHIPIYIWTSLLDHGLLPRQDLIRVEDVEEIDGHEERDGDVLPHGVGEVVLGVDLYVLRDAQKWLRGEDEPSVSLLDIFTKQLTNINEMTKAWLNFYYHEK